MQSTKLIKVNILIIFILVFFVAFTTGSYANEPITIRLPHVDTVEHPLQYSCMFFKEMVEKASGGEIRIEVYSGGALGQHVELTEAVQLGTEPMVTSVSGVMSSYYDALDMLNLAFMFKDRDQWEKFRIGPVGEELGKAFLEKTGIRVLAWIDGGVQHFYTNKPVYSMSDLKGMNMRTMESVARMNSMEAFGARVLNINWGEAYAAFQQGLADGGENGIATIYDSSQYEVLPYITLSAHQVHNVALLINEKFFQTLSKPHQEILIAAGKLMASHSRYAQESKDEIGMREMEKRGVTFVELKNRDEFIEAMKPVIEKFADTEAKVELVRKIKEIK